MKYFISQPLKGLSNKEIKEKRNEVIRTIRKIDPAAEPLDSAYEIAPCDAKPLWIMGKSLELLSEADFLVVVQDAEKRGECRQEIAAAEIFNIPRCVYDDGKFSICGVTVLEA